MTIRPTQEQLAALSPEVMEQVFEQQRVELQNIVNDVSRMSPDCVTPVGACHLRTTILHLVEVVEVLTDYVKFLQKQRRDDAEELRLVPLN